MEHVLRIEEVALLLGTSTQSINNWYRWKKLHPEHPLAQLLPDYIQKGARQTRYWRKSDMWAITEFQASIPKGRNGILGDITQKSARKNRENREKKNNA